MGSTLVTPRNSLTDSLLKIGMALCLLTTLVPIFSDGVTFGPVDLHSMLPPVYFFLALACIYMLHHRNAVVEFVQNAFENDREGEVSDWITRPLLCLLLIGFVLRVARSHEFGLNPDEAQFVWIGKSRSLLDVWEFNKSLIAHPPGHVMLLHMMMYVSDNLAWLRLPSILAGTYLIWISYLYARNLFSTSAGLAMALLVTFSPSLIDLSRACRNYAIATALLVTALYFFVRFIKSEQWKHFAGYVLFATLSGFFIYSFVSATIAVNLVLALVFLERRYRIGLWMKAMLFQLPYAALMGFLYVVHIAPYDPMHMAIARLLNRHLLTFEISQFLKPILGTLTYLLPEHFAIPFLALAVVAVLFLFITGKRFALYLCVVPIITAYFFLVTGKIPFGDSRHSVYHYPMLFGLIVSLVPQAATGFREVRLRLTRKTSASSSSDVAAQRDGVSSSGGLTRVLAAAFIFLTGLAYTLTSLAEYDAGAPMVKLYFPNGEPKSEFLTYYRQDDADHAFELLEERVGENDIVVLTFPAFMAVRLHYELTPLLTPTPQEKVQRQAAWIFAPAGPVRHIENGVTYYYTTNFAFSSGVAPLIEGVEILTDHYSLATPRKLWVLQGGWEESMRVHLRNEFPDIIVDEEIDQLSNGLILGIEGAELEKLKRLVGNESVAP